MRFSSFIACLGVLLLLVSSAVAQETTGGLQGTVKDPSGAVVPRAQVAAKGSSLVGTKEVETDGSGYYHFANLPPGDYSLTVTAAGFRTAKRDLILQGDGDVSIEFRWSEEGETRRYRRVWGNCGKSGCRRGYRPRSRSRKA